MKKRGAEMKTIKVTAKRLICSCGSKDWVHGKGDEVTRDDPAFYPRCKRCGAGANSPDIKEARS